MDPCEYQYSKPVTFLAVLCTEFWESKKAVDNPCSPPRTQRQAVNVPGEGSDRFLNSPRSPGTGQWSVPTGQVNIVVGPGEQTAQLCSHPAGSIFNPNVFTPLSRLA